MTEPIDIPAKRRDSPPHEPLCSPHTQEMNAIKDHVDLYGWSSAAKKLYGHHTELQGYEKRELAQVSHGKTAGDQLFDAWAAYPDNGWRPQMFQRPRQPEVPLRECLKVKTEGDVTEVVHEKEPLEHEKNGKVDDHGKVQPDAPGQDATPGTTKTQAPKPKIQKAATEQTPEKLVTKAEPEADECAIASDSEDDMDPPPPRRARGAAPPDQTHPRQQTSQYRAPSPPRQAPPQANQPAAAIQLPPGFNEAVLLQHQEAAARRSRKELEDMTAYARRATQIPVYLSPRHDDLSK